MQALFVQLNTEDKDLINSFFKQSQREGHTVLMFT